MEQEHTIIMEPEQEHTFETIPLGAIIRYRKSNGRMQEGQVILKKETLLDYSCETKRYSRPVKSITVLVRHRYYATQKVRLTKFSNVRVVE